MQDAAYGVVSHYYKKKVKGNHEVGLIAVVHTFGSDLKWNPHIHALFTEGGIDKNNKWFNKVITYTISISKKIVAEISVRYNKN